MEEAIEDAPIPRTSPSSTVQRVPTALTGSEIPFADVADAIYGRSYSSIQRADHRSAITLQLRDLDAKALAFCAAFFHISPEDLSWEAVKDSVLQALRTAG